jgi:CRISPR-associated exonuclease Cas4
MISLTPSHIIQYLYCPRFTWFEWVLRIPQYEERNYKVQRGREVHDQRLEQNRAYLRQRIGAVSKQQDVYLCNQLLRGKIDEVLELKDGSLAPLDYKFAPWNEKLYATYQQQLFCYAWLIEGAYGQSVHKGYLVYTRSKNKLVEVPIRDVDKALVQKTIGCIEQVIEQNQYPPATKVRKRCVHCTYRNICTQ